MTLACILIGALALGLCVVLAALRRKTQRLRVLNRQLETQAQDLQRLQQSCARFAPANVIDRIATDGSDSGAQRKEITALFVDIVGFTPLSEQLDPDDLAQILNGYYQCMSDAISRNQGHVSTFLGDGILAYFGAFHPNPWQSDDAFRTALAMREALIEYNRDLNARNFPSLKIGIGIHRGAVVAGLIGSRDRMEYACVGRTVNIAARVQALTRDFGVDILLTEAVREHMSPGAALRAMTPCDVKGISEKISTFSI